MKVKLLFLVLILVVSVLCSCDLFHKHNFSATYSSDETNHWHECECGEKEDVAEHSWNKGTVTVRPTTESKGERTFTCTVCRAQKTEIIDKLTPDHTHSFDKLNNNELSHWYECECGEKSGNTNHSWNDGVVTKQPTTESEGIRTFTCSVCNYEKTEKIDKLVPEHSHSFDSIKSNETSHWYECECGEKNDVTGHDWDNGVVTVAPTVDSEGVKTFTCAVCKLERTEKINKVDPDHTHAYTTYENDETYHWLECECGEKDQIAKHNWDSGVITTPAGEIETGITTFTCDGCDRKLTHTIPSTRANGLSFLQSTHYRMSDKLAKTPLTVEAEVCISTSQTGRAGAIFGNYYGIRQDWLFEIHENGVPRFYYTDSTGTVRDYMFTDVDVRTGELVHIALTFDYANKAISFYMNGELKQTIVPEADLASDVTRYRFVIGGDNRSNNGVYFKGQIRSVAAYSDVRSADEISYSAQHGINLYADDILMAYLLNENSGGKDIEDLSGNGYDIPKEWLDSHETTLDYTYSFAVIGDTQWLSKYNTGKMENIYDWIVANKDSKNIVHVFGLGDITEDWNTSGKEAEWITAQKYIYKLNGVIPYSVIRGNHDESKYFNKYFATEEYISQFNGEFMVQGDVRNSYKLFTVGSTDYLFMTLDYGASDEMLEWANEVVLAHPNHRVIVTTHGYQGFDGGHLNSQNTPSSGNITVGSDVDTSVGDNKGRDYNNGQQIWEKFVSRHPNIFLVMSGHTPDEDILVLQSEGTHGNIVNQMLIDPQWMDPQKGGVGMVCMLYFSEDGSEMEVEWISTDTGKYYREHNQFVLDLTDSLSAPAHEFVASYNEELHYMACECGYTYNEQPHSFDGGVINADGFMEYSCDCGYKRVASATNDPIAKELQELLDKYYNNGYYYNGSNFYNDDKFLLDGNWESTDGMLTLYDFVMGKYGELRLDLGWNYYDGVYSSVNSDTVNGAKLLLGGVDSADRVTVEEINNSLLVKLWSGDSVITESEIGYYVTTNLVTLGEEPIKQVYTKIGKNGLCEIALQAIDVLVPEYDRLIVSLYHDDLVNTVYYSPVSVWDGSSESGNLSGSGTEADPYLIQSAADFAYLRTDGFGGYYFKLVCSIDLNNKAFTIDSFNGTLDGNHCSIRGINITNTADKTGLFKNIGIDGHVYDLSLYGTVSGAKYTGALAGTLEGKIDNVVNYATVSGAGNLGGVVGNSKANSLVEGCRNYGNVNGSSWNNGGVVGFAQNRVIGCVNYGNLTTTGDCAGGVVGTAHNYVSDCINYGTVTGKGRCGGIAYNSTSVVENCIHYGTVCGLDPTNSWDLGGILGYVGEGKSASVINCVNNGIVKGTTGIGGIFGFSHADAGTITISSCINNGEVVTNWGGGGIAGNTKAEISDCVNNGTVSGKGEIGGIVGKCYGKVMGCANEGTVSGTNSIIGGIVGHLHATSYYSAINTSNKQSGIVSGPNCAEIIGKVDGVVEELITLNENVIGINHRGWYKAPENTLSAYRESKNQGFKYVECDVLFTKDGVPVLLHDDTIDRTSNGSGAVSSLTYEQLLQYDFSYDDNDTENDFSAYRGEKIPTFAEFIALCKELDLHAYVEIKGSITDEQAQKLVKIVSDADMLDNVSWLSFSGDALAKIASLDNTARIVWVITNTDATKLASNNVPFAKENLMTGENQVVFDLWYSLAKQDVVDLLQANGILLEVWTVNDPDVMLKLHPYVTGVTSDKYDASQLVK